MLKMKIEFFKAVLLLLLVSLTVRVFAQSKQNIIELKIGDQCPDFVFSNIINYKTNNAHLSDFKGKIVILDFWATWCGSCIDALPELDKVQKQFPNDLMVLPVTYEDRNKAKKFFSINKNLNVLSLPSVTEEKNLIRFFPHRMIPHEVWIGTDGRVMAITDAEYITVKNIQEALTHGIYPVKIKKEPKNIIYNNPLYSGYLSDDFKLKPELIQYQSLLTRNIEGVPSNQTITKVSPQIIKRTLTNWSISGLYQSSILWVGLMSDYKGNFSEFLNSMVILDVKDSSRFDWPSETSEEWAKKPDSLTTFCYEQIVPRADSLNLNKYMLEDLNRYFGQLLGIKGGVEIRKVKCWALLRTGDDGLLKSNGGKSEITLGPNDDYSMVKNNTIREWFIAMLRGGPLMTSILPVINESGITEPVDFEIHADLKDPKAIGKALQKYGLDFKLVERDLDMLVISDKSSRNDVSPYPPSK